MKKATWAAQLCAAALAAGFLLPAAAAGPLVDVDWVKGRLKDPGVVLIDLRKAEDFATGHIPGAVNAEYGKFGWREEVDGVIGQLPSPDVLGARIGALGVTPATQVVVIPYGKTSSDVGSATRVYWTFKVLGHRNVALLDGGMRSWQSQPRYELESGPGAPASAPAYAGRIDESLIVDTEAMLQGIEAGEVQPIDARPDNQFNGEAKHPKARIAGAIPDAKRLPQADLVDPATGKFLSASEILAVADAQGWKPDGAGPLVSYCNTGHWASVSWFALSEIAGEPDVSLYDGSMVAWTQDPDRALINSPSRLKQITDKLFGS